MKSTIVVLACACGLFAADAPKAFNGVITDTMCGADHKMMNVSPDSKCVTDCIKMGSKYALLDGTNVYELSDQKAPAKFAGQKVKVMGTLDAKTKTLQVTSIAAAK
jgi:hypothetical protein